MVYRESENIMLDLTKYTNLSDKTINLLKQASLTTLEGDILIAGSWRGGDAMAIREAVGPTKKLIVIDSFEGDNTPGPYDICPAPVNLGEYSCNAEQYVENFKQEGLQRPEEMYKMCITKKNLEEVITKRPLSLIWLDLDHYVPTKTCLEYFWDWLVPGGIILCNGYKNERTPGVLRAIVDSGQAWKPLFENIIKLQKPIIASNSNIIIHVLGNQNSALSTQFYNSIDLRNFWAETGHSNNKNGDFFKSLISLGRDYTGVINAEYNDKYNHLQTKLEQLHTLPLQPLQVWSPAVSTVDWYEQSITSHPGMKKYLDELIIAHPTINKKRPSVWSQDFICHTNIFQDWQRFWMGWFDKWDKQAPLDYENPGESGWSAALMERVTLAYFSMRADLEMKQVP